MNDDEKQRSRCRAIGQQAGYAVLALLVTSFTAVCTVEIFQQSIMVASSGTDQACRPALGTLLTALNRARAAASGVSASGGDSLEAFRGAIEPAWKTRPALSTACKGDTEALRALGEIDRLRYAEEHTVRYEARTVARRRRKVAQLGNELGLQLGSTGPTESPQKSNNE